MLLWMVLNAIVLPNKINAQVKAFPGALGFGEYVTGGRTGTVYHVTNLADAGAGSFRDAVSKSNRIIVFDVCGYINLLSGVSASSNLTIAGQTAPGGGIAFSGNAPAGTKAGEISFSARKNIICRHIRIRPGGVASSSLVQTDAIGMSTGHQFIFDHCSIEFGPYDNVDGVGDATHVMDSITFQNCLDANPTGQQFGAHTESVGGQWAWFYNVFANSHNRNPLAKVNTVFVNNVLYNCSSYYTTHTSTKFKHDLINNYFIHGPGSGSTDNTWFQIDKNQSFYLSGNLKDSNRNGILDGGITTPYWYQGVGTILTKPWSSYTTEGPIYNQQTAYRLAISQVGALPRDEDDSLIISQMLTLGKGTTGTGVGTTGPGSGLYTSQSQTGLSNNGYGTIIGGTKEVDTDGDGMPDYWEKAMGSNPLKDDAMKLAPDSFTFIEHYINWLADPHAVTTTGNPISIDLLGLTGGFSNASPVYTINAGTKGTALLQPDGHTVLFTPLASWNGMDSISFTVAGNDSSVYSTVISVLVTPVSLLPVSLLSYAVNTVGQAVQISWATSNNNSVAYFEVEHSSDGMDFTLLKTVVPSSSHSYSLKDAMPTNGLNYYRVIQHDNDGRVTYYDVKQVGFGSSTADIIYPNPTKGLLQIKAAGMKSIVILDASGKLLLTYKVPTGESLSQLNLSSLKAGNYMVKIATADGIITKKLTKE